MPRPLAPLLSALAVLAAGCGDGPSVPSTATAGPAKAAPDPWPAFAQSVRRDTDPATLRRLLAQLGTDLSLDPVADQPAGPTPAQEAELKQFATLDGEDAAEVKSPAYTPLDAAYLADAYYFRDAARALELGGLSPRAQADAAFAWVLRHLEARPWVLDTGRGLLVPALPPTAALRRGSGSGLERAYAMLGLCQQLSLDAALVGGPGAATKPGATLFDPAATTSPRGPFWAVAVRVGIDVALYDPWRGEAVPGTLAEVRAKPDRLAAWRKAGWDVPEADVAQATPYLAAPVSALAPRMALLERKLKAEAPVRLRLDLAATQARFDGESKTPGVRLWAPPLDPFCLLRTSAAFLPSDDGGRDTGPTGKRLYDNYRAALFPRTLFAVPADVASVEARERLIGAVADSFGRAFFQVPAPRELIQRGAAFEAVAELVTRRSDFTAMSERLRTDKKRDADLRDWVAGVNAVYDRFGRARLDERTNPLAVAEARAAVDDFWRTRGAGAQAIVDAAVSMPGVAEATYLIALGKTEQANRARRRMEALAGDGRPRSPAQERAREQSREKAADAWTDAVEWWGRYEPFAADQERTFPGRSVHAAKLAAEARAAAGK